MDDATRLDPTRIKNFWPGPITTNSWPTWTEQIQLLVYLYNITVQILPAVWAERRCLYMLWPNLALVERLTKQVSKLVDRKTSR